MAIYTLSDVKRLQEDSPDPQTPFLIIDEEKLRQNCGRFKKEFSEATIYYSVKANSDPNVLSVICEEGLNFDVASWGEIDILRGLGIPPERIIFSAPTKIPRDILSAYEYGVRIFAYDSRLELKKISRFAPDAKVMIRIAVDNSGAEWPLARMFGVSRARALELVPFATKLGLEHYGVTFHVGSQNQRPSTWGGALERVFDIWQELDVEGISGQVINVGGGFPVEYCREVPDVAEIAAVVQRERKRLFGDGVHLFVEPGRGLVGDAGILVTSVINRACRGGDEWLHLDTGVYHGLQETLEGFAYPVLSEKVCEQQREFTICGPTCDSTDLIMEGVPLPDNLTLGDRLYILSTGAYTVSYERYNGIDYPRTVVANGKRSGRGVQAALQPMERWTSAREDRQWASRGRQRLRQAARVERMEEPNV
jgi:ornithine decarboxylase